MSQELINQMILLFGLIALGYICGKARIMDETSNARFSTFLLKVALPATIVNSALTQKDLERAAILNVMIVAVCIFIVMPLISLLLAKVFKLSSAYQLMLNYSNLGFMGLPIISSVFGAEYVFYGAIFMMVFNLHIFTFGIITLQGKPDSAKDMLKKLATPGIIAAIVAIVIVFTGFKAPVQIQSIVAGVGSVTTPLAMMVIGSQLAFVKLLEVLKTKELYLMSALKLVIYPAITYVILYFVIGDGIITQISTILVGLPVAGNVTMLCSEYGGDTSLAAQGTCISTLFSVLTVPVMLMIIEML